jgi:UDP-N-acetyl-2-amino-2-deoxyglucuronate dehydrogenase
MQVALIGLGMVADTHLKALRDNRAGLHLKTVMGRDPDRTGGYAAKAAEMLGYPVAACTQVAEIAADPDIAFAILATPPDARDGIVAALASAGKPILMEKPVERDLAAATRLVETCEAAGVALGIVFQHRMRAASQALAERLGQGGLGRIASIDIRVPWWRDQSYYDAPGRGTYARDGGGVMISQAIHTLDLALMLMGPVRRLQALMVTTPLHRLEAEDWAGALLEFESGAVGTLHATTAAFPGGAESLTLHGTRASAHLQAGVLRIDRRDGTSETIGAEAGTGGGADPMAFTHDWHQAVLEDFALALRQGRPPLVPGREALRAHAVIHAMEAASRSGQRTEVPTP